MTIFDLTAIKAAARLGILRPGRRAFGNRSLTREAIIALASDAIEGHYATDITLPVERRDFEATLHHRRLNIRHMSEERGLDFIFESRPSLDEATHTANNLIRSSL